MIDFIKQTLNGKTIYRVLFNKKIQKYCSNINGNAIDLAGGGDASYYSYLSKKLNITRTNCFEGRGIDKIVNLEDKLPFDDESFDYIFLFNAIYIINDPNKLLIEIKRIMKNGATLYLSSPFIANEMPEPHDYTRYTYEGLSKIIHNAGLKDFHIERFGERFSVITYILHLFFFLSLIRLIFNSLAILLDTFIPKKLRKNYPMPLGYFCIIKK